MGKLWEVMNIFTVLIVVMVLWMKKMLSIYPNCTCVILYVSYNSIKLLKKSQL